MFSSRSVQIAAVFSDVFGQALPNLCRSFYNETKAEMFFSVFAVALLAEGVDRNFPAARSSRPPARSPSSRRAWIEIGRTRCQRHADRVALLAEGVDRNMEYYEKLHEKYRSPSSRRAWIEIGWSAGLRPCGRSPSSRRAWIEIGRAPGQSSAPCIRRPPRGGRG